MGKSHRQNFKLKVTSALILAAGLIFAEMGQHVATIRGIHDPVERFTISAVPFLLLAFGQWIIARIRADFVILIISSVVMDVFNILLFGRPDELGLIHFFIPFEEILLAVTTLLLILARVLVARWLERRRSAAGAAANPPGQSRR